MPGDKNDGNYIQAGYNDRVTKMMTVRVKIMQWSHHFLMLKKQGMHKEKIILNQIE